MRGLNLATLLPRPSSTRKMFAWLFVLPYFAAVVHAQSSAPHVDMTQDVVHQTMAASSTYPAPSATTRQAQADATMQRMSPEILKDVLAQLNRHSAVRAAFTQQRQSPALTQPQNSSGELLFVTGHGMLWQVQQPYPQTLALTGSKTISIDAAGRMQPVRNERGVSQISQMLQSMLGGQMDAVTRQFNVSASGTTGNWTLHLTSKQARVAQVLRSIDLDGGNFLQDIRIDMQDGTQTGIHMTDTRDAGPLTELEKRALGLP